MSLHNDLDLSWRPSHAYLPGQNSRHNENTFDKFKPDLLISHMALRQSIAWQIGQKFFREEYYWEAHEVWESVWMKLEEASLERALVKSLIQLTNAGLKGKMGRCKAQMRLLDLAKLECPNFTNREIMDISSAGWWKFYTQASRAVPL